MGYSVTSWFIDEMQKAGNAPKRVLTLGNSDYSDRVRKFPLINKTTDELIPSSPKAELANDDGGLNNFYTNIYTFAQSGSFLPITLDVGFTHPTSGDELIRIYTGSVKSVDFKDNKASFQFKDILFDMRDKVIASDDTPASYSIIPSDIAWSIVTCYGGASAITSTSNPDINYQSWLDWAGVLSSENITIDAYYDGDKVLESLSDLANMASSAIWVDNQNRLSFGFFRETSSLDTTIIEEDIDDVNVKVDAKTLINQHWVYGDYNVESETWGINVFQKDETSANSFGLRENIVKSDMHWFTTSANCAVLAQRQNLLYSDPVKEFEIITAGVGIERELSETVRFVDSFFGIDSSDGWRITTYKFNTDNFNLTFKMSGAVTFDGFYLDVDFLDGDKRLL